MIYRVHKNSNYTVISNYHLKDKNLSLKAKGLLSQVLALPNDWKYSISGLAAINKENETAITSALNELKSFGYLKVTKQYANESNTGRIEYIYDFFETPEQDSEILDIENLVLENQVQLNTNKQVNNINNNKSISKDIDIIANEQTTVTKKPKKNLFEHCIDEINERYSTDDKLKDILIEYLKMCLERKDEKRLKGFAQWKALLNKLDTLAGDKVEIVNQSIKKYWATFVELRVYRKDNFNEDKVHSVVATEEEKQNIEKWRLENDIESF